MIFLLIAVFFLIGLLFLALFRICDREDLLIFSFPVGAGLTTLAVFALEQLGIISIRRGTCLLVMGVLTTIGLLAVKLTRTMSLRVPARKSSPPGAGTDSGRVPLPARIDLFYLLLLAPLALLHGFFFPIEYWDSFSFGLRAIDFIFRTGHCPTDIGPTVFQFCFAYPLFGVLVPALESVLAGEVAHTLHKILPPLYATGTFILIYRACRKYLDNDIVSSLSSLLLCCTVEMFVILSVSSAFDMQFNFFCVASVYFLLRCSREGESRAMWLSGAMIGLAYWTNYKGLMFFAVTFAGLFLLRFAPRLFGKTSITNITFGGLARLSTAAFLFFSPHMLRNWILLKNPVYPALPSVLGGAGMTPWTVRYLLSYHFSRGLTDIIPALDIFNHGFCVLVFFVLALAAKKLWKKRERLLVATIALLYWAAWFTMMRIEDVDVVHYLMPAILLAAMLGGEGLATIFRGEARRKLLWGIAACLAGWWWFQFRLESRILGYVYLHRGYHFLPPLNPLAMDWGSWRTWLRIAEAAAFDFHELIIALALLLAYFSRGGKIARYYLKVPRLRGGNVRLRLSPALLFLSTGLFLSLPLSQIGIPIVLHLDKAARIPGFPLVRDISPRWVRPEGKWMIENLPEDSLLYSFHNRLYIIPRKIFPALSPKLKTIYEEATSIEEALEILRSFGITHIYLNSIYSNYPLWGKSIIFDKIKDGRYFTLLYEGENIWEARKIWIYRINYNG